MKKLMKFLLLFLMACSFMACGSKDDEDIEKEDKVTEKTTTKKDSKQNTKKDSKKEDDKYNWKNYVKKDGTSSQNKTQEQTYEPEEIDTPEPVQPEQPQQPDQPQDDANYVYVPEEDKVFGSYDEALNYGSSNMMSMYQKYGKAVQYGTSKNSDGQIILSWYVKE